MNRKYFAIAAAMGLHAPVAFAQNSGALHINDVQAVVYSNGLIGPDATGEHGFLVPAAEGTSPMYSSGLWMGGLSSDGQLKLAAHLFGEAGQRDFFPGPLTTDGSASISPEVSQQYDQVWSILRADVDQHLAWIACVTDPNCDVETEFPGGYVVPSSFLNWPALGDVEAGQDLYLAPFVDYDADGNYDPSSGDYPCVPGDQALYVIFNDKADVHTQSGGGQIGVEVHMTVFAYDSDDPTLAQTVFVRYHIINRGTQTLNEFRLAHFADLDIGCSEDDHVGSDVGRSLVFAVNGDDMDQSCLGVEGYGDQPPAFGMAILQGPLMDADGMDNTEDPALPAFNGMGYDDGFVDNERHGLSNSMYFMREGLNLEMTDPSKAAHFHNYLRSMWKNGLPLSYGGNGYVESPASLGALFAFPNATDPEGLGNEGGPLAPWTEATAGNTPGDRRMLAAMGPMTLEPGQVQELLVAYVYARAASGGAEASVAALQQRTDSIRAFAATIPGIMAPGSPCDALPTGIVDAIAEPEPLELFPVPASDRIIVRTGSLEPGTQLQVIDGRGALVMQGTVAGMYTGFDVQQLPAGLYAVRATQGNAIHLGRFVKE
ncbi:MAG: T9SS type A sorting domain-containing protein [Flavobacteriales bacterium]